MTKSDKRVKKLQTRGRFVMVTAYDYVMARFLAAAGVDTILVGDSIGTVVLGYPDVGAVTVEEMIHATQAVRRGAPNALVVTDIPATLASGSSDAVAAGAERLLREGGGDAVKYECRLEQVPTLRELARRGIPVIGHIGVLPQSVRQPDEFYVRGRAADSPEYRRLLTEATEIERAGAFALLLELVADDLARAITDAVKIPTIGIGSRDYSTTTAQVQVFHDLVGLVPPKSFVPKHAALLGSAGAEVLRAIQQFQESVIQAK